jgi:corrinoid protein of di/trimethylamine methyltransferase
MGDIEFLYLNQEAIKATGVDMTTALEAVEDAFRLHHQGQVNLPYKTVLDLGERERGRGNAMPAYVGGAYDVFGIKWIAGFPKNPRDYGLPRATGLFILNDAWKGIPLAAMDCTLLSAMRTGAVTGVGARYLARKDSRSVAMIGAGVQAYTQLEALKAVLPELAELRAFDLRRDSAEAFAAEAAARYGLAARAVNTAEQAVREADVVVTVTVADEPIVKDAWMKPGSFFAAVGSYQEEEFEVVTSSDLVVVDGLEHVLHRETPVIALMSSGCSSPPLAWRSRTCASATRCTSWRSARASVPDSASSAETCRSRRGATRIEETKMANAEEIYARMRKAIEEYDSDAAAAAAREAVEGGLNLLEAVEQGFAEPIRKLGEAFDRMEIFLPQLMLGSEAMKAGMVVLEEAIKAGGGSVASKGTVVIGTVEGDIHDIGKTVVAALLQANGYRVHDLGVEVPASRFIEAADSHKADIVAMSALLSTTMLYQRDVIELLANKGLKDRYFTIVGGAPVSAKWAEEIGAAGYARGAYEAVKLLDAKREAWSK